MDERKEVSITEIVSMYQNGRGGSENICKPRNEIGMDGVKSVCNIHVNLTTHKWLLFMWKKKVNQKSRRENNRY